MNTLLDNIINGRTISFLYYYYYTPKKERNNAGPTCYSTRCNSTKVAAATFGGIDLYKKEG
jgi:hypothetical protein